MTTVQFYLDTDHNTPIEDNNVEGYPSFTIGETVILDTHVNDFHKTLWNDNIVERTYEKFRIVEVEHYFRKGYTKKIHRSNIVSVYLEPLTT